MAKSSLFVFLRFGSGWNAVDRTLVVVSIEMLLYRLVLLHEVKANSEGFVFDAMFGSEGRLGYHIIAGSNGVCRCIGYVPHTTHWNTGIDEYIK